MTTEKMGTQKVLRSAAVWNDPHWCCCNYAQKIILSARIAASRLLPRCSSRMVAIGASSDGGLGYNVHTKSTQWTVWNVGNEKVTATPSAIRVYLYRPINVKRQNECSTAVSYLEHNDDI